MKNKHTIKQAMAEYFVSVNNVSEARVMVLAFVELGFVAEETSLFYNLEKGLNCIGVLKLTPSFPEQISNWSSKYFEMRGKTEMEYETFINIVRKLREK